VAGVALGALGCLWWRVGTLWSPGVPHHFAWQAWNTLGFARQARHLGHWAGSGGVLGRALVARGAAPLCLAGVELGHIHLRFAWHAWHLVTSFFVSRGTHCTCRATIAWEARHPPSWQA